MDRFTEAQRLRDRLVTPYCATKIDELSVRLKTRTIPLSRSRHVRGWHPVRPDHNSIPYESKLESKVITALARLPELVSVISQPITIQYRYLDGLERYTPDFLVELQELPQSLASLGFGLKTYVEVKPLRRSLDAEARLARKFSALNQACGLPVALVTEWDLSSEPREVGYVA